MKIQLGLSVVLGDLETIETSVALREGILLLQLGRLDQELGEVATVALQLSMIFGAVLEAVDGSSG